MKLKFRWGVGSALALLVCSAQPAPQLSDSQYALFPGDFNGDGRTDLLYIARLPGLPNGIALADASGTPQMGFQSWSPTYLGVYWSLDYIQPVIGDFDGDGQDDLLLQSAAEDPSYLVLSNNNRNAGSIGQLLGISQAISPTAMGLKWPTRFHKILVGDFDGDGADDLLLQGTERGAVEAIVLADAKGGLFTRTSDACWKNGPQRCWGDGEMGFNWSTADSSLAVGDFNADGKDDVLVQGWPEVVSDASADPPWHEVFAPLAFGTVFSQGLDKKGRLSLQPQQLWDAEGLGTNWSPMLRTAIVGDFNGDGRADVFLQGFSGETPNQLVMADRNGQLQNAVTLASEAAGWSADRVKLVVGRYGNSKNSGFYVQRLNGESPNGYAADVTGSIVTFIPSDLQPPEGNDSGLAADTGVTGTTDASGGVMALSAATPPSPPSPPSAVGALPATANVTEKGAAAYTIPIDVPAGTAGLTPTISLTYNSNTGNGLAGVGWTVTGLGTITRCPKTLTQDNVTQGVQLTTNDEYCLNGNRLRRVSGSQGQANSEYRTELETFSRAKVTTSSTYGPTKWEVWRKDGLIEEYGGTTDSNVAILGNLTVFRLWALSKVRDRANNYYSITYTNNVSTYGSYQPNYIDYTGNSQQGTAAPYRIQFTYEARNVGENVTSYYMGGLVNLPQRLKQIDYRYGGTIERKYVLTYQAPADSFNVASRLGSVQQCSPTACMGATTFAWSDMAHSGNVPTFDGTVKVNPYEKRYLGAFPYPYQNLSTFNSFHPDLNGDGIPDQIEQIGVTPSLFDLYYRLSTPHGQPSGPSVYFSSSTSIRVMQKDVNIDGMEEFILGQQNGPHTWLHGSADGTVTFDSYAGWVTSSSSAIWDSPGTLDVDVNGDGYKDRVSVGLGSNYTAGSNGQVYVRLHPHGEGDYLPSQTYWTPPTGRKIVANLVAWNEVAPLMFATSADIDGDGRQDTLVQVQNSSGGGGWQVLYSNGTSFVAGELLATTVDSGTQSFTLPTLLDMNGDGCSDAVYHASGSWRLATSKCRRVGTGALNTAVTLGVSNPASFAVVVAGDANGDGNQDMVISVGYPYAGTLYLSTGVGFGAGIALPSYPMPSSPTGTAGVSALIDLDGDGLPDATSVCPNPYYANNPGSGSPVPCDNSAFGMRATAGPRPNLLVGATDAFGKTAQFAYAPLTDASVYTRGSLIPGGETQNTQGAMYVAKTMTLSNGIGGTYTQTYRYSGAKRNLVGRGFLGFATREITDSRTGFVTTEAYENSVADGGAGWEFVGILKSRVVRQSSGTGPLVEELTLTNASISPDGATDRKYPYAAQSVLKRYELTGAQSPYVTRTTTTALDNYGTPYDVTTTTTEGITGLFPASYATQRVYTPTANILNDTTNWCIARPQRVEETRSHTLTDGASETRVATQTWDAPMCRVTSTTQGPGTGQALTTTREYDLFNNVKKTTVSGDGIPTTRQPVTQVNYGSSGHLLQSQTVTINGVDRTTSYSWDIGLGVRLTQTDPNSLVTAWQYDDFGREKLSTRPDLTSVQTLYYFCDASNSYCGDSLLRYVVRKVEKGIDGVEINHVDQFFDVVGRIKYEQSIGFGKTVTTPELVESQTIYDSRGNVAQKSNPYYLSGTPVLTTMTYDNLGRVTLTQRPNSDTDSTVISEGVTYAGLTVTKTDALSNTQVTVSSAWGTALRATDEAGKNTTYTYNGFGDLKSATDPLNNKSSISYNIRGFRTGIADPDKGSWSYTNDALGRVLNQVDAKGQITTFIYDEINRTETRDDSPGGATNRTTWTWDTAVKGVGQLASVSSPGGYQESYMYDTKGRRSQVTTMPGTGAGSYLVTTAYDDVSTGKPLDVTYPASTGIPLKVRYAYQNGFVKSVTDWTSGAAGTVYWTGHTHDARGHVTKEVYGNNQITNLGFDQTNGRLYTIQTGAGGGTGAQNLVYNWDAVGNLASRQDLTQGVTESFQYDAVYRLQTVQRNGSTTLMVGYNDIGNILSKSDVGTYTYPTSGASSVRPHAVSSVGGVSYIYDANGNMASRGGASVTWSTYDYPTTINQAGGNTSTFSYGPDRQVYRQVSVDGAVTEDRTIIGGLFEKNIRTGGTDPGTEYRHFIQANGKLVAVARRTSSLSEIYYPHEDHLGSTDVITKSGGGIELRTSFDAWGKRRGSNWTGTPSAADKDAIRRSTHKGYTGHEQLDNLDLVHMGGRVYDPVIARFMSADPIIQDPYHSQSFNRYSYVWNNPLNATDPTGLESAKFTVCTGTHVQVPLGDCFSQNTVSQQDSVSQNGSQAGATAGTNASPVQAGANGSAEKKPDGSPVKDEDRGQSDVLKSDGVQEGGESKKCGWFCRMKQEAKMETAVPNHDVTGNDALDKTNVTALDLIKETSFESAYEVVTDTDGNYKANAPERGKNDHESPVQRVPGIAATGHTHVPSAAGNAAETASRTLPGPGDHVPVAKWGVPNYYKTPTGGVRVVEFVGGAYRVRTVRGVDAPGQEKWKAGACNAAGRCESR